MSGNLEGDITKACEVLWGERRVHSKLFLTLPIWKPESSSQEQDLQARVAGRTFTANKQKQIFHHATETENPKFLAKRGCGCWKYTLSKCPNGATIHWELLDSDDRSDSRCTSAAFAKTRGVLWHSVAICLLWSNSHPQTVSVGHHWRQGII